MDSPVNVICIKWGTKYDASNVNRLHEMVRRHLTLPHRFVCFTDDAAGIDSDVETRPLPTVRVPPGPERCWNKLGLFAPDQTGLRGMTLYLDLDIVILNSIDSFFSHPGEFLIIRDWSRDGKDGRAVGNSSVFRFDAEKHVDILESFHADAVNITANYRCDQDWITHRIGQPDYWPEDWCRSFKRHCLHPFPLSLVKEPRCPSGTRILIFHGNPKPEHAAHRATFRPMPLRYFKRAPWLSQYL